MLPIAATTPAVVPMTNRSVLDRVVVLILVVIILVVIIMKTAGKLRMTTIVGRMLTNIIMKTAGK